MLTENARIWNELLNEKGEVLRLRPSPDRWSTLEYTCHVRDVFRKFDERVQVMVSVEGPTFPNWDQDATAVDYRYNEQSPVDVAGQLTAAAGTLATGFSQLSTDQWERPGSRSDGARFTLETLGRYLMHDPVHHLYDVGTPSAGDRAQIRLVNRGGGTKSQPWRRFAGAADNPGYMATKF